MKDIHDVITHAKFGDDRLRGSRVVAGQISAFPIDFVGRPYNTLTLPCDEFVSFVLLLHYQQGNYKYQDSASTLVLPPRELCQFESTCSLRYLPSVLCRCWLGDRKGIWPVKTEWWGAGVCLNRGADLHMAQLMPLPLTVSYLSNINIGFTFLVPAYLGSPGKRAVKQVFIALPAPGHYVQT